VGTRLITSAGDSALGGVYKLVALYGDEDWLPAIKISESSAKTPNPGTKQVWRIYDRRNMATCDLVGLADEAPDKMDMIELHHHTESEVYRRLEQDKISGIEPLLTDVLKDGNLTGEQASLEEIRQLRRQDLERLDPGVRRLLNPHVYHVSLTPRLKRLKQSLVQSTKASNQKQIPER
jgi:nicotinate phosphoribosyltransferase